MVGENDMAHWLLQTLQPGETKLDAAIVCLKCAKLVQFAAQVVRTIPDKKSENHIVFGRAA